MFISFVIAFIIAVFSFYQFASLPNFFVGLAALLGAGLLGIYGLQRTALFTLTSAYNSTLIVQLKVQSINVALGFIIGMSWVVLQTFFTVFMDEAWLNKPVQLTGTISDLVLVEQQSDRIKIRFQIKVDKIQLVSDSKSSANTDFKLQDLEKHSKQTEQAWSVFKPKIQLSWYLSQSQYTQLTHVPKTGEVWQLVAKLKANHAAMNLGSLDYETWLFQNGITASGYLLNKPKKFWVAERVHRNEGFDLRGRLADSLQKVFAGYELKGLYQALTYGDKKSITDAQWQVLQSTGTIHLMAISGLHMGIIAALGYWLFKGVWWLGLYRLQRFSLPMLGAVGAWLFATLYLVLSGYAIPTQRAYLMVMVVLLFLVLRREFQPWSALAMAALVVVVWDTKSVLSLGFWLSFLAVALIFAILQIPKVKHAARWQQLLWIQLVLTIGLAPYLIWAFHYLPSYSFISNLFAVPFVSLIGLPLLFLLSLVAMISIDLALWLMPWIDQIWGWFWSGLQFVSTLDYSTLTLGQLSGWGLLLIMVCLFVILLHRNFQIKLFALLVLISLVTFSWLENSRPQNGQARLHLLDVGQGQALVIETQSHVLVYDTGAKWGDKMDGAKLAILPLLRSQRWSKINLLIVSHSDIDHAGGLERLIDNLPVKKVLSGQAEVLNTKLNASYQRVVIQSCQAGQGWGWDGVKFEILSPGLPGMESQFKTDNDQSCVLKVTAGRQSVLIPGDLSAKAEKWLIELYDQHLQSTILIAGHHGSRYSSSEAWLNTVNPQVVLFSAGYNNRYGFPAKQTLQRLAPSIRWFNTACSGGIGYTLGGEQFDTQPEYQARKIQQKWYHHSCLASEKGRLFQ